MTLTAASTNTLPFPLTLWFLRSFPSCYPVDEEILEILVTSSCHMGMRSWAYATGHATIGVSSSLDHLWLLRVDRAQAGRIMCACGH